MNHLPKAKVSPDPIYSTSNFRLLDSRLTTYDLQILDFRTNKTSLPWHQLCYHIFDFLLRVILKKSENIPSTLDLGNASERKEKIKQPPVWWLFLFCPMQ